MRFSEKSEIGLLALPDFVGYLFRKTKIDFNHQQLNGQLTTSSDLVKNCTASLVRLSSAKLFHYINTDDESKVFRQMFRL